MPVRWNQAPKSLHRKPNLMSMPPKWNTLRFWPPVVPNAHISQNAKQTLLFIGGFEFNRFQSKWTVRNGPDRSPYTYTRRTLNARGISTAKTSEIPHPANLICMEIFAIRHAIQQ